MIYICGGCNRPTYVYDNRQSPSPSLGSPVESLPPDIHSLYEEARQCGVVGAYTCSVLANRKLIMHIAVDKSAEENKSFAYYVDYLAEQGYVPPGGKVWVDRIRVQGNDANHEIVLKSIADANEVLGFAEMLLRFIYEFPVRISSPPPTSAHTRYLGPEGKTGTCCRTSHGVG